MQLQDEGYYGSDMAALKLGIAHTKQRTLLWCWHGCSGHCTHKLQDERYFGVSMLLLWDALSTRASVFGFGHGCSGYRKHWSLRLWEASPRRAHSNLQLWEASL